MLLSVLQDDDGYIQQFCTGGYLDPETQHLDIEDIPDDFYENFRAYKLEDGALVLDTNILPDIEEENERNELRAIREVECFSIINRGELWYSRLTEEQIAELNTWYNAWLDVTETRVIPIKPDFLWEV